MMTERHEITNKKSSEKSIRDRIFSINNNSNEEQQYQQNYNIKHNFTIRNNPQISNKQSLPTERLRYQPSANDNFNEYFKKDESLVSDNEQVLFEIIDRETNNNNNKKDEGSDEDKYYNFISINSKNDMKEIDVTLSIVNNQIKGKLQIEGIDQDQQIIYIKIFNKDKDQTENQQNLQNIQIIDNFANFSSFNKDNFITKQSKFYYCKQNNEDLEQSVFNDKSFILQIFTSEYQEHQIDLIKDLIIKKKLKQSNECIAVEQESETLILQKKQRRSYLIQNEKFINLEKVIQQQQKKQNFFSERYLLKIFKELLQILIVLNKINICNISFTTENVVFGLNQKKIKILNFNNLKTKNQKNFMKKDIIQFSNLLIILKFSLTQSNQKFPIIQQKLNIIKNDTEDKSLSSLIIKNFFSTQEIESFEFDEKYIKSIINLITFDENKIEDEVMFLDYLFLEKRQKQLNLVRYEECVRLQELSAAYLRIFQDEKSLQYLINLQEEQIEIYGKQSEEVKNTTERIWKFLFSLKKFDQCLEYNKYFFQIKKNDFSSKDYFVTGLLYFNLKNYSEAINYFKQIKIQALKQDQLDIIKTSFYLAVCHRECQNYEESQANFESAIKFCFTLQTKDLELQEKIFFNFGIYFYRIKEYDNALRQFQKCRSKENQELIYYFGCVYFHQENFLKALPLFQKFISNPQNELNTKIWILAKIYVCKCLQNKSESEQQIKVFFHLQDILKKITSQDTQQQMTNIQQMAMEYEGNLMSVLHTFMFSFPEKCKDLFNQFQQKQFIKLKQNEKQYKDICQDQINNNNNSINQEYFKNPYQILEEY